MEDVDFEQGLILVKQSFSDVTKSNKARVVPILNAIKGRLVCLAQNSNVYLCVSNQDRHNAIQVKSTQ